MVTSSLPSMECSFQISTKGEDTGTQFEGSFTYKRPNIKARKDIVLYNQRLRAGEKELTAEFDSLFYMLAFLKYTLVDAPQWWKESNDGQELYDMSPIVEIFTKTQEFEESWRKQVFGEEKPEVEVKEEEVK